MKTYSVSHKHLIVSIGLAILYVLTRLLLLTNFPMLNDESIYLYWAQQIVDDSKNLMVPLSEGRQPLFIWMISWYMRVFQDPLLAGRLVSVSAGLVTLLGVFLVTKEIFKKTSYAIAAGILYIASPFSLVYDRLALLDSLVTTFTIWSIYFTILLARSSRLDTAYTLGLIIGGGIITKSNGVFNLYLLPFSLVLLSLKKNKKFQTIFRWTLLLLVVFGVSQIINSIITTVPQYSRILDVNQIFIIPKREFIKLPLTFIVNNFFSNFGILLRYFAEYFTFPYLLLLFVSIIDKSYRREKLFLFLYFLLPLCALAIFGRQLLPRYIYFMTISLYPLCGYGFVLLYTMISKRWKDTKLVRAVYASLVLFIPVVTSLSVIKDIRTAYIPLPERINYAAQEQVFVKESTDYIQKEAKTKKVFVAIEGYIGWAPNMYQVLLHDNKNVVIKAYPHIEKELPEEVLEASSKTPTYLIVPRFVGDDIPKQFPVIKILEEKVFLDDGKNAKRAYYMRMFEAASKKDSDIISD